MNRVTAIYNCSECAFRKQGSFCDLHDETLDEMNAMKFTTRYPEGAILFSEGEEARGVFILCSGKAKLMASSEDGRVLITHIAEGGEVLGLSATVLGSPYELTAETIEPAQVAFIRRVDLLRFLGERGDAMMHAAMQLSADYRSAQREIRTLGLTRSMSQKLATLLLDWCERAAEPNDHRVRLTMLLTHEEIAQMIGTTRETVTRLLSQFKAENLIEVKGSTIVVNSRAALQQRSLVA